MPAYGISVPDRQLACAPVDSPEGRAYLGAMAAAANFGLANRQLLTEATHQAFTGVLGDCPLELLYDVSHNLAKREMHEVDGVDRLLCVHRKGATRALPPGHPELPADLASFGQPVLIPGSMGTASYVLTGVTGNEAFNSTCHGAGRVMSRHAATRRVRGSRLRAELEAAGIAVWAMSTRGLAEEVPFSYKDADEVVETCEHAGLARRVARLRPIGVVKGIVEAWAPTRAECLAEAVAALTESYADTSRVEPTRRHVFRLAAATGEQAIVALLDEALYVLDALGAVPVETHLDTPGDAQLTWWFTLADVDRIRLVGSVPKGIALSGLGLRRLDGGWRCTATVDV